MHKPLLLEKSLLETREEEDDEVQSFCQKVLKRTAQGDTHDRRWKNENKQQLIRRVRDLFFSLKEADPLLEWRDVTTPAFPWDRVAFKCFNAQQCE